MRGRLPKPTAVRVLEGNPGHRALNALEPRYAPTAPDRPDRISKPAAEIWDELIGEMSSAAVLARVDRRALWQLAEDEALLAEAYAGIWKMMKHLKKSATGAGSLPGGAIFELLGHKEGRLAMSTIRDLAARVITERREFGLTPSSRSRLHAAADGAGADALELKLCG